MLGIVHDVETGNMTLTCAARDVSATPFVRRLSRRGQPLGYVVSWTRHRVGQRGRWSHEHRHGQVTYHLQYKWRRCAQEESTCALTDLFVIFAVPMIVSVKKQVVRQACRCPSLWSLQSRFCGSLFDAYESSTDVRRRYLFKSY